MIIFIHILICDPRKFNTDVLAHYPVFILYIFSFKSIGFSSIVGFAFWFITRKSCKNYTLISFRFLSCLCVSAAHESKSQFFLKQKFTSGLWLCNKTIHIFYV